jgi:hypothetical protein
MEVAATPASLAHDALALPQRKKAYRPAPAASVIVYGSDRLAWDSALIHRKPGGQP